MQAGRLNFEAVMGALFTSLTAFMCHQLITVPFRSQEDLRQILPHAIGGIWVLSLGISIIIWVLNVGGNGGVVT